MHTPTGSRWMSYKNITRCHRRFGSVAVTVSSSQLVPVPVAIGVSWGQDAVVRASGRQRALGPQWPQLSSPPKVRKKCCYGQRNFGSMCSSLSLSPIHLSHTRHINPFENKVWEVYFYKEVCSFVHWSSSLLLTMFPYIYIYIYEYTTTLGISMLHFIIMLPSQHESPWPSLAIRIYRPSLPVSLQGYILYQPIAVIYRF